MSRLFNALREGDVLFLDGTHYVATGRMVLRAPDGEMWTEWLLAPRGLDATQALQARRHRWLVREDEAGMSLWSPTDLPAGFTLDELDRQTRFSHEGKLYAVIERDHYEVARVYGDVGDDVRPGERVDYVDLRSAQALLSVEWNDRGADACLGKRVGDHLLAQWSKAADSQLAARAGATALSSSGTRTGTVENASGSPSWVGWVFGGIIFSFILLAERCDGTEDCYTRVNPTTGQSERVCEDGVRSRSGRSHGGWGGK